jgi:hypothetical protein
MKTYEGKYEPTLIYTSFKREIALVRRYGIEKHGNSEDWPSTDPVEHFNAIERHIDLHIDGEFFDTQSGLYHLSHAAATLMFEIERLYRLKREEDGLPPIALHPRGRLAENKSMR